MPFLGVQAVFVVVLMFGTTAKTEEQAEVTFWKKTVTVKCPNAEEVFKFGETKKLNNTFEYESQGLYKCGNSEGAYLIFIKGRACDNCFELNGEVFIAFLIVDLIGTVVVIMIIYRCFKKKSADQPSKPTKPTSRQGGRGPPVPNPDYESLNVHTMSDTYSTMNNSVVSRMG